MGRPVELRGQIGELARVVGGTAALAVLLGVSPRTLQHWAQTALPRRARLLFDRIASEYKVPLSSAHGQKARRAARTKRADSKGPKRGRPLRLPSALGELARAVGGTMRLAALLGVHTRTVQKWAKRVPPAPARCLFARLAAEYGLSQRAQNELAHFNEPRAHGPRARSHRPDDENANPGSAS